MSTTALRPSSMRPHAATTTNHARRATTPASSSSARLLIPSWRARLARAAKPQRTILPHPPRATPLGLEDALYAAATAADEAVRAALPALNGAVASGASSSSSSSSSSLSLASLAVVWAAGVATSLSPCTLSVLPLTLGYLAAGGGAGEREQPQLPVQALAFSAGLATTLAALGVASALAGKAYGVLLLATAGSDDDGFLSSSSPASSFLTSLPPVAAGALAVVAGLALLDALPPRWTAAVLWALRPPSAVVERIEGTSMTVNNNKSSSTTTTNILWPRLWRAYAAGLVAALAASPCATPVLASILAWVSATRDPGAGGVLLLAYSSGYVAPLLVAGMVAERVQQSGFGGGWGGAAGDDGGKAASAKRVAGMLGGGGSGGQDNDQQQQMRAGDDAAATRTTTASAAAPTTTPATTDPLRGAVRSALASGAPEMVSRASGFMLVAGGVYAVLSRVVPVG